MELVAAPSRIFKTWSMWLIIATGVFDLAVLAVKTLSDAHVMAAETVLIVNVVLAFMTGVARLIAQQIPATAKEKVALIKAAEAQPIKPGEATDVVATVTRTDGGTTSTATNAERLQAFIEVTVSKAIDDAMAKHAAKPKPAKPRPKKLRPAMPTGAGS